MRPRRENSVRATVWDARGVRSTNRLIDRVEQAAARDGFALDDGQRALLLRLADLGAALGDGSAPRGLYVHGDAGRGKSWLADAFYAALPPRRKTRVHVHGFFDELHRSIFARRQEPDAIERAVDDVTDGSRLVFFDELHVDDAGDARLLTRLLRRLSDRGVTVLATSNNAPHDLLPNPVWHHTFESGIALITAQMDVWHLEGPTDYRTVLNPALTPVAGTAAGARRRGFATGSWTVAPPSAGDVSTTVEVGGRAFTVTSATGDTLVATFDQLCAQATSTIEYLHWARAFPRWVITDVPPFETAGPQTQQRFITLIDVLADRGVPVDFSSQIPLADFLAASSERPGAFRMTSRLHLLRTGA